MAFLLVPVLDRSIRQDDVRMVGIVQLRRSERLPLVGGCNLKDDNGPAIELLAPSSSYPVANLLRFYWRRHVETIDRDFGLAFGLQKHVDENAAPLGPPGLTA